MGKSADTELHGSGVRENEPLTRSGLGGPDAMETKMYKVKAPYEPKHWRLGDEADLLLEGLSEKIEKLVDEAVGQALKEFLEEDNGVAVTLSFSTLKVHAHHLYLPAESPGEDLIQLIDEAIESEEAYPEYGQGPLMAMKKAYDSWVSDHPNWVRRSEPVGGEPS